MTRPRPTVAEVIRSCLDEFLDEYDPKLTPEQRRALEGPDRLPHRGPGRSRPGVPRVWASTDRLQLLRQPPLPHLPGHGRGTVAGGPRRGVAPRAVLPPRLHAAGCPRPDRTGQSPGRLRPAACGPPPRPCSRWPPTPTTSAPGPACWPCCTPGARPCSSTRTSTASCRVAGCPRIGPAGSARAPTSSCRCGS